MIRDDGAGGNGRGPRVLAIANQKGGVGKTTTAINLGTALAAVGETVLIVDLDPQGNASTGLGLYEAERNVSTYDVLSGRARLAESIAGTSVPDLFVAPSTLDLLGLEREILSTRDRQYRLRDAVAALAAESREPAAAISYVIVDCPPSLNILTINALAAAGAVLVPVQCEYFAMQGIVQLKKTIDEVRSELNPDLDIQGVVMTMYDQRNKLSGEVEAEVRRFFGDKVYSTLVPRNVRVAEAPSFGQPLLLYDHKCPGSQAYIALASEMIGRERKAARA
jgi:chromosome partitioning protein